MTVEEILEKEGVILNGPGHFVFPSMRHSARFANGEQLITHPSVLRLLCSDLSSALRRKDILFDVAVGPERGASAMLQWLAHNQHAASGRDTRAISVLKDGAGGYVIDPRFKYMLENKLVLMADDVTTTGGTLRKVAEAIRNARGIPVAAMVIWAWQELATTNIGNLPYYYALGQHTLETWTKEECAERGPCSKKIAINLEYGHGKEFLASQKL